MKRLLIICSAAVLLAAISLAGCGTSDSAETDSETAGEVIDETEYDEEEPVYEPLPSSALPLNESVLGEWYAFYEGLTLTLSLTEEGDYMLHFPGQEDRNGSWAITDGDLILDSEEAPSLIPVDDALLWESAGLLFTREVPETYVPAEVDTAAAEGDLNGYWRSHYVAVEEGTILASAIGENTDIYIEGTHVALGGPLFGDVFVDMSFQDGVLSYEGDGTSVTLSLQQDGFLRLDLDSGAEDPVTIYLLPAPIPESIPE